MKLLDEMEKTFPELEKVYDEILLQHREQLDFWHVMKAAKDETACYAMEAFLKEGSALLEWFECAGFSSRWKMAQTLTEWMLFWKCANQNVLSRSGNAPVQE